MENFMANLEAEPPQRGVSCVENKQYATPIITFKLFICGIHRNVSHNSAYRPYFS